MRAAPARARTRRPTGRGARGRARWRFDGCDSGEWLHWRGSASLRCTAGGRAAAAAGGCATVWGRRQAAAWSTRMPARRSGSGAVSGTGATARCRTDRSPTRHNNSEQRGMTSTKLFFAMDCSRRRQEAYAMLECRFTVQQGESSITRRSEISPLLRVVDIAESMDISGKGS